MFILCIPLKMSSILLSWVRRIVWLVQSQLMTVAGGRTGYISFTYKATLFQLYDKRKSDI